MYQLSQYDIQGTSGGILLLLMCLALTSLSRSVFYPAALRAVRNNA